MDPAARTPPIDPGAAARPRPAPLASVQTICRWALCALLATSAAAKLLTPHQVSYVLPEPLYYLGAVVELAVAALLHTRHKHLALAIAIAFALTGLTIAALLPGRLCGCFGSLLPLDGKGHVLLAGLMGALASLGFWSGGRQDPADRAAADRAAADRAGADRAPG